MRYPCDGALSGVDEVQVAMAHAARGQLLNGKNANCMQIMHQHKISVLEQYLHWAELKRFANADMYLAFLFVHVAIVGRPTLTENGSLFRNKKLVCHFAGWLSA